MNYISAPFSRRTLRGFGDVRDVLDRFLSADDAQAGAWVPRVDIKEEEGRFVIFADVPGVDPASIEVSMDKNVLSIKGERRSELQESTGQFTRVERASGAFHRRFALPESADAEGITATGKHGVLEIAIPKRAQVAPRRIAIETAH